MKSFILFLAILFSPSLLWAHPEHGFGFISAEDKGKSEIYRLVNEKVLPETWNTAYSELDMSGEQVIKGKNRWVMVYRNPGEKDPAKALIKIIMTPLGKFVAYEFVNANN